MTKFLSLVDKGLTKFDQNSRVGDTILAVLLAVCPLLQHYRGPVYNMAITVLVFAVPYIGIRMLSRWREIRPERFLIVLIPVIYQIYRIVNHGTSMTEFGQSAVFIAFLLALALDCIDLKALIQVCRLVCFAATLCLIAQYICFYIFGFHLQLVVTDWFIPSAEQWILCAQTGLAGITGKISDFYRPSAFFLEPSHVYIYMFPHLFLFLFSKGSVWKTVAPAALLTVGLVLTTSGMAVAIVVCAWALFFLLYNEKDGSFGAKNIFRIRNLIALGILAAVFAFLVVKVPSVQRTVARIFKTKTGISAIGGRVTEAVKRLKRMSPMEWVFGIADTNAGFRFNLPGALDAIYRHGLIGCMLSFEFYGKSVFKQKLQYFLIAIVIIATSFFSAHTHSTVGMLYYTFILMYGFRSTEENPNNTFTGYAKELAHTVSGFARKLFIREGGKQE